MKFKCVEIRVNPKYHLEITGDIIQKLRENTDYFFNKIPIKQEVATTLVEAKLGTKNVVIKRINAQNKWTVLRRFFTPSRVDKNWIFSEILFQNNMNTFAPIMWVKKKWLGLSIVSYVYMSKIEGVEARVYFEQCQIKKEWQNMADKIIALIENLNKLGLRHRDLNLSNIIINKSQVYLIDLDAMKTIRLARKFYQKKEIKKFIENIEYLRQKNNPLFLYFYNKLESIQEQ